MLKPFKIKVESAEHSKEIQEWLFSLGYRWWNSHSRYVDEVKAPFLFLGYNSKEGELSLSYGYGEEFFEEKELPEAWFYDGKLQDHPKQTLTNRDLINRQLAGDIIQIEDPYTDEWEDKDDTIFIPLSLLDEPATDYRIKPLESANNIMTTNTKEYSAGQSINTIREMLEAIIDGQELEHILPTGLPNDWIDVTDVRFSVDQLDHPLMWDARVKLPRRMINGVEVPHSVDVDLLEVGQSIYIPDLGNRSMYSVKTWNDNCDRCINYKEREMIYLSVDDAVVHAKAWLGQETE